MTSAYASLGADELLIRRAALVTTDRYGKQSRDWTTAAEHTVSGVSVQPLGGAETVVDREYAAARLVAYGPADADILATDRAVWRGTEYEVDGPPERWIDDTGTPDHVKVTLKLMTG